MSKNYVYVPFPKNLYDDIIRLSDGVLDPAELAKEQVLDLIFRNLDGLAYEWFGDRLLEFAEIHFPHAAPQLMRTHPLTTSNAKPLVWKEITIPAGTKVRMQYGDMYHFADVKNGKIHDDSGFFTPSEWASKVANNTSRNAWRDIWFKDPGKEYWRPADLLRSQARTHLSEKGS